MSRFERSIPPDYFEERYRADPDPWQFETSDYERAKYARTLVALPAGRYDHALEVGCSIGVLTEQLASRCGRLLAIDVSEEALGRARDRCRDLPRVTFGRLQVPGEWPDGSFDLILLSEVVYYLDREDVARLARRVAGSLRPGGDVVLVHWTGETHYPLSGDEAARLFIEGTSEALQVVAADRQDAYRLDVLTRLDALPGGTVTGPAG